MSKKIADLNSDTVTKPCAAMRQVIFEAEVGDDMVGEDPTVNRLQELVAQMFAKEASLFAPSGTMSNELGIKAITQSGDAIITLPRAHIYAYESGAASVLAGVTILPMGNERGIIEVEQVKAAIPPDDQHFAPLTVLCVENTYNGHIVPLSNIKELYEFCHPRGIKMHLDGARIFNASVASGVSLAEYGQYFDTISFCLSKGLGAPIGSMVCGSTAIIKKVHRFRKLFGGAMRQVGLMAAAGIYALENNIERLAEDHRRAQMLKTGLEKLSAIKIINVVETNMVFIDFSQTGISAPELKQKMLEKGIKISVDPRTCISRLVTHLDLDDGDIEHFISSLVDIV